MALTADVHIPFLGAVPRKLTVKAIGADTFFAGALVFADGTSGKAQVVPAATDHFLGICVKQVVAATNDAIEIYIDGVFALKFAGVAEADVGDTVVVDMSGGALSDDHEDLVSAADATIVAGDVLIGQCMGITTGDTAAGWVVLHQGGSVCNVLGWL